MSFLRFGPLSEKAPAKEAAEKLGIVIPFTENVLGEPKGGFARGIRFFLSAACESGPAVLLPALFMIELQRQHKFLARVEIRDRASRGSHSLLLGVNFIIHVQVQPAEAEGAIAVRQVCRDVLCVRIFQVNHGGGDRKSTRL